MENTIIEMQQNLTDGMFIAFLYSDDEYCSVTKTDDIEFLNGSALFIKRKSGMNSIINLNMIVEIEIRRELF